jgi:hypothetical protein
MTPLDYLLSIMRDENEDGRQRIDAAKAAAPYCHARLSSTEVSGPSGGPVAVQTTTILDVSHITDEAELDALERALRKTVAGLGVAYSSTVHYFLFRHFPMQLSLIGRPACILPDLMSDLAESFLVVYH